MRRFLLLAALAFVGPPARGGDPSEALTAEQREFFEKKIQPVLVERCYRCHSSGARRVRGGLMVDTRKRLLAGGDTGPAIVPGDASASLLIEALRYEDLEMPPDGRLDDGVIADFERWIAMGAPDPRKEPAPSEEGAASGAATGLDFRRRPERAPAPPPTAAEIAGADLATGETFFIDELYPLMRSLQCDLCHSDNGVASATRLEFPGAGAGDEKIAAFGLRLMDFVDREEPAESPLLRKPTDRDEHTGGQRIAPGSHEERMLLSWINYLAGLSGDEVLEARERIARAEQVRMSALTLRRLTHSQYDNTVRDLLGDATRPASRFPKEDFVRGFRNQLESQGITPLQAEAYGRAAERLALGAFRGGDHLDLVPCDPATATDPGCAEMFVSRFGLRAFRRPLTDDEVKVYTTLLRGEAARANDFLAGARLVVETMLQSPHFLFLVERGPGEPFAPYETASRLSYFIWNTAPTEELLRLAASGELSSVEQVEAAARRMLDDPRARSSMEEFLAQWMRFDLVLGATRDRRRYRQFDGELAAAMVEETRRLFDHLVWDDRDFMEFYTADYTFPSAGLARIYGLPEPPEEFARVSYPRDCGRAGVLGHASFLVATSKPAETSPTERGLFIRNHFLSHEVPPPPAGVNTALPEITTDAPMTNRQRLGVHLNSEACAGCHRLIDPIGLGFEQYDAIGAFEEKMVLRSGGRRDESAIELEIDPSAYIQGLEDSDFSSPRELGRILAASDVSQRSIVKQLFRYTYGRQETPDDRLVIDAVFERFRASGFRFRELIVAMATSKLFLQRSE